MTWVWVLVALLVVVLLLILFVPVTAEVHYKREGKDDRLHVGVRALFGLVRLGYDIPIIDLMERRGKVKVKKEPAKQMPKNSKGWVTITVEKIEKLARDIQKVRERIGKYKRAIRKMSKSFQIESFRWKTMFGTGDAAQTAVITGLAWGFKGFLGGMMYQYFTVKKRLQYDVKPHFQAKGFRTELKCMIRFQIGKTLAAGLTLALLYWKEGRKQKHRSQSLGKHYKRTTSISKKRA
ncbi:MAG: DUF2953 domain-containing protein [Tumebacillaceae bacterium]